jgi:hypothetical protein
MFLVLRYLLDIAQGLVSLEVRVINHKPREKGIVLFIENMYCVPLEACSPAE